MQTINRHNYEEYFLLYIDDELNAASKLEVENFVQQNADLAVELQMLMQTKSSPEEIVFIDKENLLRTEGNSINEKNYEEYFLLYIDKELSAAKREEVEMYVLQHPALQDEFTGLKRAVLIPEIISYGDKKDLYRTEKRRTFYLKPWHFAAAAIFIGVCITGIWFIKNQDNAEAPVAINQSVKKGAAVNPVDTIQQQQVQLPQQTITAQSSPKKENKIAAETAVKKRKEIKPVDNYLQEDQHNLQTIVVDQHPVITHNNNIAKQQKEPPAQTHDIADVHIPQNITQKPNDVAVLQTPIVDENDNGYKIYPVAYKEINTNDDDRSLHVGMLDLNKDKVKNLFKKAGRLFGNKSNDLANEDGKLQVANFEIDTKKQ